MSHNMKMPADMYEALKRDFYATVRAAKAKDAKALGSLTMRDAWHVLTLVEQQRQYTGDLRAKWEAHYGFPCAVAAIDGYRMGPWYTAGLNDSHIATALKRILAS